jgi:hypothetical protein
MVDGGRSIGEFFQSRLQSVNSALGFKGVFRIITDYFSGPQIHQQAEIQKTSIGVEISP